MQAIVLSQHGPPDCLALKEAQKPLPADNEVLIRVKAAALNKLDSYLIRGPMFLPSAITRRLKPKNPIPGADVAGVVETVGGKVTQFHVGDEVFGGGLFGAFAEFACELETQLAGKPEGISFEEAAAAPVAAITALQGLRDKGGIQAGWKVLIEGASGGLGTYAIQFAKFFSADVTAVCSSRNLDLAKSLGADHVIDYSQEDFTQGGQKYDLIFGANAYHSIFEYRRALTPDGIFVIAGGGLFNIVQTIVLSPLLQFFGRKKTRFFVANMNSKDLTLIAELLQSRKIISVIDRTYPFEDTIEALLYREEGHAKGKVVLTFGHRTGE